MAVAVWLNLARSGGTLLARCLGSMEGVALLSEVHPLGAGLLAAPMSDPADQAFAWHRLLTASEAERWRGGRGRFDELIGLLSERAAKRGKLLVLRDWSHLDFLGAPFTEPAMASRTLALLEKRLKPRRFASVRHPADQWASQQRLDVLRGRVDPDVYLRGCRAFAELATGAGFVRYEDFTRDPDGELARICEGLGAAFDPAWRERYRTFDRVTGDAETTAGRVEEIRPATRRQPEAAMLERFRASGDYTEACRLLGYAP